MTTQTQPITNISAPLRWPFFAAYGIVLWFVFALVIRTFGAVLFVPGSLQLVLSFALLVPIAYLGVWSLEALGAKGPLLLPALVVATIPAGLLDGLALTWTTLYGPAAQTGAAWILWGVAWTLLFALTWRKNAR